MNSKDSSEEFLKYFEEKSKGYYEYNRESPGAINVDEKENAIDSLETALQFLSRDDNLKWKWFVFALHHSLYSFCISSLEHGNYEQVLSKGYDDDNNIYTRIGDDKPRKSKIKPFLIKGYKMPAYRIEWEEVDQFPDQNTKKKTKRKKEKLISFWTALARVQDDYYWMRRYIHTKAVKISDDELYKICWLSERVRNDLMHFVPKSYAIGIVDIIETSKIILNIIEFLVFESFAILFVDYDKSTERIKSALKQLRSELDKEERIIKSDKKE